MKNSKFKKFAIASVLVFGTTLIANANSDKTELQLLQQAVLSLQQRVEILETVKPTFTSFMPDFSERFHVMHRAGEAGDWAVAGHELSELRRMTAISQYIDTDNGMLMQGMLEPSFEALSHAIEDANHEKFETALGGTISACNACHVASESPFIKVTLNAANAISLRHPHALTRSHLTQGHSHGEPMMMQKNMQGMTQENVQGMMKGNAAPEKPHDDSGEDGHHD